MRSKHEIRDPATVFSQIEENVPYDGFLGGAVLRNFTTIFDFSRGRMILDAPRQPIGLMHDSAPEF